VNVTQLFDLRDDPDEARDLAGGPAHAERIERMLARLRDHQVKYGDDAPLTVAKPKPAAWTPPKDKSK
jgi:hypothetical protein